MEIILVITFVCFLFFLYSFCHDDFVFFRKNITTERFFNLAFIVAVVALFFARLGHVVLHYTPGFLNPIMFLAGTYFPGLSLTAGISFGILALLLLLKTNKLPKSRVFDVFLLSFLGAFPVGLFLYSFLPLFYKQPLLWQGLLPVVFYIVFFGICAFLFVGGKMRDGSVGNMVLLSFSVVLFVAKLLIHKKETLFSFANDDILLAVLFIIALFLLLKQEKLLPKVPFLKNK